MDDKFTEQSLLHPYRVLDLADEKGLYCGRVLADLGADVIKVEPPGGDNARRLGPFYHDKVHPEKSLYWFALNMNKRSITLDFTTATGKDILKRLIPKTDCIVETFPVGYMDRLGLGYAELCKINPQLVYTAITPFGQKGPYANFKASDLGLIAMGSEMFLQGDADRPPVRVPYPQSYLHAGAQAALGSIIALYHAGGEDEGQFVDVSIQASVVRTTMSVRSFWDVAGVITRRSGQFRSGLSTTTRQRLIWHCKDGFVNFPILGGKSATKTNYAITKWMEEDGCGSEFMNKMDWGKFDLALVTQEILNTLEGAISKFFMKHTRAELFEGALKRRVMLYPVNSISDLLKSEQLGARNFWQQVKHPELQAEITYPGPFAVIPGAPIKLRQRAPAVGENNLEILGNELGFTAEQLITLKGAGII